MSCLVHDKRFRSSFHTVINELRNEKRTPVAVLKTLPHKCCTCNDENNQTVVSVVVKEEDQLVKLKNLIERVNREKQNDPKLILSLNRFKNLINENRGSAPVLPKAASVPSQIKSRSNDSTSSSDSEDTPANKCQIKPKRTVFSSSSSEESSSSSDSDDIIPMETSQPKTNNKKKQNQREKKPLKSIKNGTFLFLPYVFEKKTESKKADCLIEVAKELQRKRFLGRNGHIAMLEKQYGVRINMVTPKTSEQVTEALENAKKGLENLTIRNQKQSTGMSKKQDGEWVLVRSKKSEHQTNVVDFDQILDDLTNRWETCLNIKKRKKNESESSDDFTPIKK
jgi:hypothetical protein